MSSHRVEYDEVVRLVKQSNPELGNYTEKLIEKHSDRSEFYCYVLKYRYGSKIIDSNGLRLPENTSEELEQVILNDILKSDNKIPFGIILENNAEVFLTDQSGIVKSLAILREGNSIGSYEAINVIQRLSHNELFTNFKPLWQIVAGTRSIFLPNLFNSAQVKNDLDNLLKSCNLPGLEEYQKTFPSFDEDIFPFARDIINCKSSGIDWSTTLIIFPNQWLETIRSGITPFHQYIYDAAWIQTANSRNKAALVSKISEYLPHYGGNQAYTFSSQVLLDLFEIGLGYQHSYKIVQENSSRLNGPFSEFIKILQGKLDMNRYPLLMLEPTYIQSELKILERRKFYYSSTAHGKILSNLGGGSPINLTNLFFTPIYKVLEDPKFIEDSRAIYGSKVNFQLYGKIVARKSNESDENNKNTKSKARNEKTTTLDIREIFTDSIDKSGYVNYNHSFFRGLIEIRLIM
jgi:hypothetical protein